MVQWKTVIQTATKEIVIQTAGSFDRLFVSRLLRILETHSGNRAFGLRHI